MTIPVPGKAYRNASLLCVMIFLTDLRLGILAPNFPIFIVSLGGTVALVGALAGLFSLTRLVSSIPAGLASDSWGRKRVLIAGLVLLAGSTGAYGFVHDLQILYPIRVLEGLGHCVIYTVGAAALSDSVPPARRGSAIGVYMMSMGFGNSLGGTLGGTLADLLGTATAFWIASSAVLLGLVAVALLYRSSSNAKMLGAASSFDWGAVRQWVLNRSLLPANLGIFVMSMTFNAAVLSFFPLYAVSLGIKGGALGAMFGMRNLVSTVVRFPVGTQAVPSRRFPLMLGTVALAMMAIWSVPFATDSLQLTVLLCAEGMAFGSFITIGQAHMNAQSERHRGIILGIYATFGSLGSTLGAFALGPLAQAAGISSVFPATSVLLAGSLAAMWLAERSQQVQGAMLAGSRTTQTSSQFSAPFRASQDPRSGGSKDMP